MTKKQLFIKLSNPNKKWESRWVSKTEFVGEYESLNFNNGCPWIRNFDFLYETKYENKIWMVRLTGNKKKLPRQISLKVRQIINILPSAHSGLNGTQNDYIIPDHKNGRYDDDSVLDTKTQKVGDFQPLTLRENLFKRQSCKVCRNTNQRFNAVRLGYKISFIEGGIEYEKKIGCVGCYWYDCIKFKQSLFCGNK